MNEKTSLDIDDTRAEWFFDRVDGLWRRIAANLFEIEPLPESPRSTAGDGYPKLDDPVVTLAFWQVTNIGSDGAGD